MKQRGYRDHPQLEKLQTFKAYLRYQLLTANFTKEDKRWVTI